MEVSLSRGRSSSDSTSSLIRRSSGFRGGVRIEAFGKLTIFEILANVGFQRPEIIGFCANLFHKNIHKGRQSER